MIQALVKIDENTNRVLNVVKAKYGLKDKGEAIQIVVGRYIEEENEADLRPEFIEQMDRIAKEKTIKIGNLENFRKRYGMK